MWKKIKLEVFQYLHNIKKEKDGVDEVNCWQSRYGKKQLQR